LFISHSPGSVQGFSEQILQAITAANAVNK
jgi:hypothetical protein